MATGEKTELASVPLVYVPRSVDVFRQQRRVRFEEYGIPIASHVMQFRLFVEWSWAGALFFLGEHEPAVGGCRGLALAARNARQLVGLCVVAVELSMTIGWISGQLRRRLEDED